MDGRERLDCTFVWLIDEWMDVDGPLFVTVNLFMRVAAGRRQSSVRDAMHEPRSNWQKWEHEKQHEVQRAANTSGFGSHFATNDDFYFIVSHNV